MTRTEQSEHNEFIIRVLKRRVGCGGRVPSYKSVVDYLNSQGLFTSRENAWTSKSLFRMLQRNGYSGLHGLQQSVQQGVKTGISVPIRARARDSSFGGKYRPSARKP